MKSNNALLLLLLLRAPFPTVAQLTLVQYPGANFCAGNTWVYDCARMLTLQSVNQQIIGMGQAMPMAAPVAGTNSLMGSGAGATAGASCGENVQGIITGAKSAIIKIPTFKGIAVAQTQGNDTLLIALGGEGSQCVAGYKLVGGQFLNLGRDVMTMNITNTTATNAAGEAIVAVAGGKAVLAALIACLLVVLSPVLL